MAESMTGFKRSCMCGLVNETMTGENVTVMAGFREEEIWASLYLLPSETEQALFRLL